MQFENRGTGRSLGGPTALRPLLARGMPGGWPSFTPMGCCPRTRSSPGSSCPGSWVIRGTNARSLVRKSRPCRDLRFTQPDAESGSPVEARTFVWFPFSRVGVSAAGLGGVVLAPLFFAFAARSSAAWSSLAASRRRSRAFARSMASARLLFMSSNHERSSRCRSRLVSSNAVTVRTSPCTWVRSLSRSRSRTLVGSLLLLVLVCWR